MSSAANFYGLGQLDALGSLRTISQSALTTCQTLFSGRAHILRQNLESQMTTLKYGVGWKVSLRCHFFEALCELRRRE